MKYNVLIVFGCIGVCFLLISHAKPSAPLLVLLSEEVAEADEQVEADGAVVDHLPVLADLLYDIELRGGHVEVGADAPVLVEAVLGTQTCEEADAVLAVWLCYLLEGAWLVEGPCLDSRVAHVAAADIAHTSRYLYAEVFPSAIGKDEARADVVVGETAVIIREPGVAEGVVETDADADAPQVLIAGSHIHAGLALHLQPPVLGNAALPCRDEYGDVDVGGDQRGPDAELEHITRSSVLCGRLA